MKQLPTEILREICRSRNEVAWIISIYELINLLLRAFHVPRHLLSFITWRYHIKDNGGIGYEPSIRRGGGWSGRLYRSSVWRCWISVERKCREFLQQAGIPEFLSEENLVCEKILGMRHITKGPVWLICGAKHRETMKYLRGSLILGMLTASELFRSPPVELLLLDYNDNSTVCVTSHLKCGWTTFWVAPSFFKHEYLKIISRHLKVF